MHDALLFECPLCLQTTDSNVAIKRRRRKRRPYPGVDHESRRQLPQAKTVERCVDTGAGQDKR